jgi:hypothetical protein
MKAYVTKLALTKGIIELDDPKIFEGYVVIGRLDQLIRPIEWFNNRQSAVECAEEMRINKIASLRKQIAKLESMKFE